MFNIKKFCELSMAKFYFYGENPSFFTNNDGSQKPKPVGFRPLTRIQIKQDYCTTKIIPNKKFK